MHAEKSLKIGELLLRESLLTENELNKALLFQKNQKVYKPFGEICIEKNFFSKEDFQRILRKYNKAIKLGELLINLELITSNQLNDALVAQKSNGGKLGRILVKQGNVTETSLINALSMQLDIPKINPDIHQIDPNLLKGLGEDFLLKNEVLPAFKDENFLTVIMANPDDKETIRNLSHILKCKIKPAIASSEEIRNSIKRTFRQAAPEKQNGNEPNGKELFIGDLKLSHKDEDNIVSIVNYIFTNAVNERASDIHIEPNKNSIRIRYRIDGMLLHKTDLPSHLAPALISRIKVLCRLDIAEKRRHQDGRIGANIMGKQVDFRISIYASVYGESVVIRILPRLNEFIDINALGLSPVNKYKFRQILNYPSGIMLTTGPTGSGKTTTLYAAIVYLNNAKTKIITVEDPVEYMIDGIVQGQVDPKLGLTYEDFIKSMMRQDPDVLMLGEVRDPISAQAVIQAALTGHKVLSTFHTEDSTGALLRLMDMKIETFLISSTVVSIIAQRLVRVLCKYCKQSYKPDKGQLFSMGVRPDSADPYVFYRPTGCSHCNETGFRGRTALHEMLVVNDAIRDAILARKTSSQIRLIARQKSNMVTMREDGFYKAVKGITSLDEIQRVIFYAEVDELYPRTAGEIVRDCEEGSSPDLSVQIKEQSDTGFVKTSVSAPPSQAFQ
jgi:type IV pilus assembly protein PilB